MWKWNSDSNLPWLRLARSGGGAYSVCTENFIDHATNEEVASWCKVYTATIPMTSGTTDGLLTDRCGGLSLKIVRTAIIVAAFT